jgi:2-dehydropantoate 2-reductase
VSPKILVVGAGAIGGLFGARLAEAGRDVTFLVRPHRAKALRESGLKIKSVLGDLTLEPKLVSKEDLTGTFDIILLSVKAYTLDAAMADFAPAVGPTTVILPLLNGMSHISALTGRFGKAVIGGICRAVVQLDGDGTIIQTNPLQQILYGELDGSVTPRIEALHQTLSIPDVDASLSTQIVQDLWEKWVQLASLGAITCLLGGSIGEVAAEPMGVEVASAIFNECLQIAAACGHSPSEAFQRDNAAAMTKAGSTATSSMYRDKAAGRPVEVDHIIGDLIAVAKDAEMTAPSLLQAAFVTLRIYQATLKKIGPND